MLFESCPRIRRTDTVPFGRSSTGRGMPDICFGSGIANPPGCAPSGFAQRTQRKEQRTQRAARFVSTRDHPLVSFVTFVSLVSIPFSVRSQRLATRLAELRVGIVRRGARRAYTLG